MASNWDSWVQLKDGHIVRGTMCSNGTFTFNTSIWPLAAKIGDPVVAIPQGMGYVVTQGMGYVVTQVTRNLHLPNGEHRTTLSLDAVVEEPEPKPEMFNLKPFDPLW